VVDRLSLRTKRAELLLRLGRLDEAKEGEGEHLGAFSRLDVSAIRVNNLCGAGGSYGGKPEEAMIITSAHSGDDKYSCSSSTA
jgi:hypothetical protein